ncbi:Esa1p-associated factor [Lobulomyces angularis]|nr:Esa1p-associated factor [Lobulomyces angularis]
MDFLFEKGEKILCFHGPLLYEAKVLKKEIWEGKSNEEDGPHYFVHYQGWKEKWDEWVPESRGLKMTEENLKKQKDLVAAHTTKKPEKKSEATAPSSERGKKRKSEHVDTVDEFAKRVEIKIPIPEELKIKLVDDWETVTKNQRLVSLPRDPTVTQILQKYREHIINNPTSFNEKEGLKSSVFQEEIVEQVTDGLKLYFDKALGNILLYRFERFQYVQLKEKLNNENNGSNNGTEKLGEATHAEKCMSDYYGAEHLLRLFVQLPSLIAHTNMETDAVNVLKDHFALFLQWMVENADELFLKEYEHASAQYLVDAKNCTS